ncbi:MAG: tRNA (adenosine(37)-N6)-threonylcarbamoyltransferase complex dimerization subunit type 1 TsaB [Phototrophicaceae bacterium]|jgi:tRNA threonylcarbamoyladenosine biosynthesis protein TsaB
MLLALDTATTQLSLALHDGTTLLAEQTLPTPNRHTEQLALHLRQLLNVTGQQVSALSAIAVVTGPGSYTGVRIGVAFAKGLAAPARLPLIGVSALDATAAGQPHHSGTLIALVRAGRGRVIVGRYRWSSSKWVARGEPKLMAWAELFSSIDGRVTLAGDIDASGHDAYKQALTANAELKVDFALPAFSLRRAGFVAEVAWGQLRAAAPSDFPAAIIHPVYMNTLD